MAATSFSDQVSALDTIVGPFANWSQPTWTVQQFVTAGQVQQTGGTYV